MLSQLRPRRIPWKFAGKGVYGWLSILKVFLVMVLSMVCASSHRALLMNVDCSTHMPLDFSRVGNCTYTCMP